MAALSKLQLADWLTAARNCGSNFDENYALWFDDSFRWFVADGEVWRSMPVLGFIPGVFDGYQNESPFGGSVLMFESPRSGHKVNWLIARRLRRMEPLIASRVVYYDADDWRRLLRLKFETMIGIRAGSSPESLGAIVSCGAGAATTLFLLFPPGVAKRCPKGHSFPPSLPSSLPPVCFVSFVEISSETPTIRPWTPLEELALNTRCRLEPITTRQSRHCLSLISRQFSNAWAWF